MAKRRKIFNLLWGLLLGNISCYILISRYMSIDTCSSSSDQIQKEAQPRSQDVKNVNLIMVGVMTAPKYFETRAKAVYRTWGRELPGDIKFYSSEGSRSSEIPLIALEGVDDSYPPQKKSLMMLKHMHDNYLNTYEWFMRADDDVYVRADRLEELLRSVDSKKTWFIGQTGRGNSEEFGLLSLDSDENFCMGGPGVIFSRETLKKVAPFVEDCLRHLYTTHEDVELGRCVRRFAGVSCTWSYQMQVIFYHNQSGHSAFTGDLKQKEIHQAITLHPVKQSEHLFRLHKYFKGLNIQRTRYNSLNLQRDLFVSSYMLGMNETIDKIDYNHINSNVEGAKNKSSSFNSRIPASIYKHPTNSLNHIHDWEFITTSLFSPSDLNPKRRIGSSLKEALSDVIVEVMELINSFSKQRGRLIEFKEIMYAYWRVHPIYGVEYILDLLLVYRKYRGHKMTIQVRRHAYIQQTFTAPYIREVNFHNSLKEQTRKDNILPVPVRLKNALFNFHQNFFLKSSEKQTIHFVLPLYERFEIFNRFMKVYEKICLTTQEFTKLIIILHQSPNIADTLSAENLIKTFQNKYGDDQIIVIYRKEKFSRGPALQLGIDFLNDQDLMFLIDVDMVFNGETLEKIRKNTVPNKSVYFPIVFSLYNPKITNKTFNSFNSEELINDNDGFWRQFGFGIVSLYKSDYVAIGGFNLMIIGWGFEDVTFYDKTLKTELFIVRTADPSLIHVYHPIYCNDNLDNTQKNMCLGTEASALGSSKYLQTVYANHKYLFE